MKITSSVSNLMKRLLTEKAEAEIKEFLRFHPGAENDLQAAFAMKMAELGRQASALGAVSVAAVQDLFEQAFTPPRKGSSSYRKWEPFFPDWKGICKGMNKMLREIKRDLHTERIVQRIPVLLEFFRQVAARGAANPPMEDDFLKTQDVCNEIGEWFLELGDREDVPAPIKREIVDGLERCVDSRAFSYYGVCNIMEVLPAVAAVALPPDEALQYVRKLGAAASGNYDKSRCTSAELAVLRRMGQGSEAERILSCNTDNVQILGEELYRLMREEKDFEAALALVDRALLSLAPERVQMRSQLHACRLKICRELKDAEGVAAAQRELFVLSGGEMEYYDALRQYVPPAEWPAFYEKMVEDTFAAGNVDGEQMAAVYAAEKDFTRLEILLKRPSFDWFELVEQFAPLLSDSQQATILELAMTRLRSLAQNPNTRREYSALAECMRKTRAMHGGADAVADLAAELRVRYHRRSALLQALEGL